MEPREGVDTRDIISGHRMRLLNNMRVETNGPNVNSRKWWGSTSTQGGVAGGCPSPEGCGHRTHHQAMGARS